MVNLARIDGFFHGIHRKVDTYRGGRLWVCIIKCRSSQMATEEAD